MARPFSLLPNTLGLFLQNPSVRPLAVLPAVCEFSFPSPALRATGDITVLVATITTIRLLYQAGIEKQILKLPAKWVL